MSERYVVVDLEGAKGAVNWPMYDSPYSDEHLQYLIDTGTNKIVYHDQDDCPEDKYLFRDLGVFVDELNKLSRDLDGVWEELEFVREHGNL